MIAFNQMNECDKVQAIRDTFIILFKSVVNSPKNLHLYISEKDRKSDAYIKAEAFILMQNKKTGCLCGSCVDLNVVNDNIPSELGLLLDVAIELAKTKSY